MKDPVYSWIMAVKAALQVRPDAQRYLRGWKQLAKRIPDPELRKQALLSIETKTFHCEGGAIYALLAGRQYQRVLSFIIAYQTISDYLDNLCDRSHSFDPEDFQALHESMIHALTPGSPAANYYRLHQEQNDGGYLSALVETCQKTLSALPAYSDIAPVLRELAGYYCELQIHKHVRPEDRVPRLKAWFESHRNQFPPMQWYEFAACTGSTLGIFCLIALASGKNCTNSLAQQVRNAYFPWVQGLHILLDYLVDQEEDRDGGDLNFCSYYAGRDEMAERLKYFHKQAEQSVDRLPNARFHHMIIRGLVGLYLADRKVDRQKDVRTVAQDILRDDDMVTRFLFLYCWISRRI